MKKMKSILGLLTTVGVIACAAFILSSCSDDEITTIKLVSLTADGIDLNGATSPTNIPTGATITATFNVALDETASDFVSLVRQYDAANVDVGIVIDGKTMTISHAEAFGTGVLFILSFDPGFGSKEGSELKEAIERNFTTEGTFAPGGAIAHWTFEDSADDIIGNFDPAPADVVDVTYVASRSTAAGKAASFNGTTTIIEIPNGDQLMANNSFSLSFWMNANSTKQSHFVMGLAAWYGFQFEILGGAWDDTGKGVKLATRYAVDGGSEAEDTWWNGNPNGWQGSLFSKDVSGTGGIQQFFKDKWAHVVCTYDAATKVGTMYVNGEKTREWDFDLWPEASIKKTASGVMFAGNTTDGGNNFAIGFIQASGNRIVADTWADPANPDNNHFMGLLDDIRVFKQALTGTEISLMYNSEKP